MDLNKRMTELLKGLKEGDHQILDLEELMNPEDQPSGPPPVQALSVEEGKMLTQARWKPQAGDLVELREDWPFNLSHMRWPSKGEICSVTYVPEHPRYITRGDEDGGGPVIVEDMVLGWKHFCGREGCKMEGTLIEYGHDSRMFRRVGNVYDMTPPVPGTRT